MNTQQETIDHLREQIKQTRQERDDALCALAEIEAMPLEDRHQSAILLRRFRLGLITPRQRHYDRLVADARRARATMIAKEVGKSDLFPEVCIP